MKRMIIVVVLSSFASIFIFYKLFYSVKSSDYEKLNEKYQKLSSAYSTVEQEFYEEQISYGQDKYAAGYEEGYFNGACSNDDFRDGYVTGFDDGYDRGYREGSGDAWYESDEYYIYQRENAD